MKCLSPVILSVLSLLHVQSVMAGPQDIWALQYGSVAVQSDTCTGNPSASESGVTSDSVVGTDGIPDQYGATYTASLGSAYYSVSAGSNTDEQTIFDLGAISTTDDDSSNCSFDAEYELQHESGGNASPTVYITYEYGSIGDSHSASSFKVYKNSTLVLEIHVATDEVLIKDGNGNTIEHSFPNEPYFGHNFLYKDTFPISLSTGDTISVIGGYEVTATEGGSDISHLDMNISTISP